MRKIRSKEILSVDELAEIGSIAVESTECEVAAGELLWHLAGMDEQVGEQFTRSMSISTRLDMLRALGSRRLQDGAELDEFRRLIDELKDLNGKRNHAIHGSWGAWMTLRELFKTSEARLSTAKALKYKAGKPTGELLAADLAGLPERISDVTQRLMEFADKHWPRKPF